MEPPTQHQMGTKVGLFRYSNTIDKLLMFFGTLGCIGDGMTDPIIMIISSSVMNSYGTAEFQDASVANHLVDKNALRMVYVAIGGGISAFIGGICWTRTAERQTSRMRTQYLKSVLRQEVGFFDNQGATSTTSQVISGISSDSHIIQDVIAEKIHNFLVQISNFIFYILAAFQLSWRLALIGLPLALTYIVPAMAFGKLIMNLHLKMKDAYEIACGVAEQAISSIRTVYSCVGERQTLVSLSYALQKYKELGARQGLTKGLMMGAMCMIHLTFACQAWYGSILVTKHKESGASVFMSGMCILLGGISLLTALPNITFFADAKAAATRISKMIDRLPLTDFEDNYGTIPEKIAGEIEFREVDFNYPSRPDMPILQGFNLKVQAGKTVGLVGSSGSGKSTVISLIERFYEPIRGDIFLDGQKIKKLQLKWLRSQIGLVNQEPVLFATSIKENILLGNEQASMEDIVRAAKAANAHSFITKLPKGYDTQVGQFGVQVSGGQKQRIAIARALLRDPKILLLDEATSALDANSERTVQQALDNASLGRTTIIVAHNLTTISKADMIVVLQSGRILEAGSHDELMQLKQGEGGAYFRMAQLQQSAAQGEITLSLSHPSACIMSCESAPSVHRVRLNSQSSSDYFFSPFSSFSEEQSFEMHPSNNTDDKTLMKASEPAASQWRLLRLMNTDDWTKSVLACLGAIGVGAIQSMTSYCLGSVVVVYVLRDHSKIRSEANVLAFLFLGQAVAFFIASSVQHFNFAIMGEHLTKRVREKMLAHILTFEIGWFDKDENTSAAILARLATEVNAVRSLTGDRVSLLVQTFTNASLSFALALAISWRIAIVLISFQPFLIGSYYLKMVLVKKMSEMSQKAQNEGSQLASEAAVNHRTITAFSSQNRILSLFETTLEGPRKLSIKQSWFIGFGLFSSQFLTAASSAFTLWYGARLMNQGLLRPKSLFQVFFVLMGLSKTIADAGSMTSDLAKGGSAVKSLFALLDQKSEIEPDDPQGITVKKTIEGDVVLNDIYFCYPSRPEQMILKGLNLIIEAGKTVALVGQSGSGKSTIIGLIERFYDPIKGSILIDQQDVRNYNLRNLRSHMALVSQEPTLFAGTIRQNIVYGNEDATEADIIKAANIANAHEFISSMKDGYETFCGERGVQLSGGQKQRIALARAILRNPAILLLDEATSALDSVTENLVQGALEQLMAGRTCVIVAHRLSTIKNSDFIAVLKDGKIVEKGSHDHLLSRADAGFYYSLVTSHFSNQ